MKEEDERDVIECNTAKELTLALVMLEINGYKWRDGRKPTCFIPSTTPNVRIILNNGKILTFDNSDKFHNATTFLRYFTKSEIIYRNAHGRHAYKNTYERAKRSFCH